MPHYLFARARFLASLVAISAVAYLSSSGVHLLVQAEAVRGIVPDVLVFLVGWILGYISFTVGCKLVMRCFAVEINWRVALASMCLMALFVAHWYIRDIVPLIDPIVIQAKMPDVIFNVILLLVYGSSLARLIARRG